MGTALSRTIDRLLDMDLDTISDEDLIRYVHACRDTLGWARREVVLATSDGRPADPVRRIRREWTEATIREAMLIVEREGTIKAAAAAMSIPDSTLYQVLRERAPWDWFERAMVRARKIRRQRAREVCTNGA